MVSFKSLITGLAVIETAAAAAASAKPEPFLKALTDCNKGCYLLYSSDPEFRTLQSATNKLFGEIFFKFAGEKRNKIFRFKSGIRYSDSLDLIGLDVSDLKFVK